MLHAVVPSNRKARARRREDLPGEVRGEMRLASETQTETGQESPIHQGLRGHPDEPEQDHQLVGVELGEASQTSL